MILTRLQRLNRGVSPFQRVVTLREELDNLFGQAFGQPVETPYDSDPDRLPEGCLPALDLYEDKEGLVARVELPGLKKEDIAISLHEGALTVSGERKQDPQLDAATVRRSERVVGRFERRISLPCKVDAEKIKATYTDGVLTVTLPKAEEAKLKNIPINIK